MHCEVCSEGIEPGTRRYPNGSGAVCEVCQGLDAGGQAARRLLRCYNLKGATLADRMIVSPETVSSWNTGRTSPSTKHAGELLEMLDGIERRDVTLPGESEPPLYPAPEAIALLLDQGVYQIQDIASKLGVHRSTVSGWANGTTETPFVAREELSTLAHKAETDQIEVQNPANGEGIDRRVDVVGHVTELLSNSIERGDIAQATLAVEYPDGVSKIEMHGDGA